MCVGNTGGACPHLPPGHILRGTLAAGLWVLVMGTACRRESVRDTNPGDLSVAPPRSDQGLTGTASGIVGAPFNPKSHCFQLVDQSAEIAHEEVSPIQSKWAYGRQLYFPRETVAQDAVDQGLAACLVVVVVVFGDGVTVAGNGVVVASGSRSMIVAPAHLVCREDSVAQYACIGILPGSWKHRGEHAYSEYAADVARVDESLDLALLRTDAAGLVTVWEVERFGGLSDRRRLASIVPFGVPTVVEIGNYSVFAFEGQSGSAVYAPWGCGLEGFEGLVLGGSRKQLHLFVRARRDILNFLLDEGVGIPCDALRPR